MRAHPSWAFSIGVIVLGACAPIGADPAAPLEQVVCPIRASDTGNAALVVTGREDGSFEVGRLSADGGYVAELTLAAPALFGTAEDRAPFVWAAGPGDAWVLERTGELWRGRDGGWSRVSLPGVRPETVRRGHALGGTATGDVWLALGESHDDVSSVHVHRFDGSAWSEQWSFEDSVGGRMPRMLGEHLLLEEVERSAEDEYAVARLFERRDGAWHDLGRAFSVVELRWWDGGIVHSPEHGALFRFRADGTATQFRYGGARSELGDGDGGARRIELVARDAASGSIVGVRVRYVTSSCTPGWPGSCSAEAAAAELVVWTGDAWQSAGALAREQRGALVVLGGESWVVACDLARPSIARLRT